MTVVETDIMATPAADTQYSEAVQQRLVSFEERSRHRSRAEPNWLFPLRKAAMAGFAERGFPTVKDEDWRFTNVAPVIERPFSLETEEVEVAAVREKVLALPLSQIPAYRLVFINGNFTPELSTLKGAPDGAVIENLSAALASQHPVLEKHLCRHSDVSENPFGALNTGFFSEGAFVYIPRGVQLREPVHVLNFTTEQSEATNHPRALVVVEAGASVTVLESYAGEGNGYFNNVEIEFSLGKEAHVEHCKFQDESLSAFHISNVQADLDAGSIFKSHSIALGSRLSRNNIRLRMNGEGVHCVLNGLYLAKDDQLVDHHMVVDHAAPRCESHEYFNGILDGRSKGVFHGRIHVRAQAQKTDAKQTNKNLLLTDDATANTKPQLEIYADDVKCTHGATIGQLNDESIFYLRARGISLDLARRMLIHAFAGEIIDRIDHLSAREELDGLVWKRLEENPEVATEQEAVLLGGAQR